MRTWILAPALAALLGTASLAAQSFRDEGAQAFQSGDYEAAVTLFEKSLAAALKVMQEEDLEVIERRAELGETYRAAGRLEDAIKQLDYVWKRARYDAERKSHWDQQEGTMALSCAEKLGRTYQAAGRYQDALVIFSTGLFDARRTQHDEDALQFCVLLAETQFVSRQDVDAAHLAAEGFAMAEKLSAKPVLQSRALSQLSMICLKHRQLGLARPMAQRALEIAQGFEPAGSLLVADYQAGLAAVLLQTGALEEAEKLLQDAAQAILAKETPQSTRLVEVLLSQADLFLKKNEPDKALTKARDAVEICRRRPTLPEPRSGRSLLKLGDVEMALNRPQDAREHYEQALTILDKTLGPDDPATAETRAKWEQLSRALVIPAASSGPPGPGK